METSQQVVDCQFGVKYSRTFEHNLNKHQRHSFDLLLVIVINTSQSAIYRGAN